MNITLKDTGAATAISEKRISASGRRRRREAIQTAHRLFSEQGYEQTSLQQIAAAADTTVPTLYNYFGSKQGLLLAIFDTAMQRLAEILEIRSYPHIDDAVEFLVEVQIQMLTSFANVLNPVLWVELQACRIQRSGGELADPRTTAFFVSHVRNCLEEMKMRGMIAARQEVGIIAEIIDHLTLATLLDHLSRGVFDPEDLRGRLARILTPLARILHQGPR